MRMGSGRERRRATRQAFACAHCEARSARARDRKKEQLLTIKSRFLSLHPTVAPALEESSLVPSPHSEPCECGAKVSRKIASRGGGVIFARSNDRLQSQCTIVTNLCPNDFANSTLVQSAALLALSSLVPIVAPPLPRRAYLVAAFTPFVPQWLPHSVIQLAGS